MNEKVQWWADKDIRTRRIRVTGYVGLPATSYLASAMVAIDQDTMCGEPTLTLSPAEAQGLLDSLWEVGIRPSNGEGNLGEVGAVKSHLADMRRIAFGVLELKNEKLT
jgi:hypothetical protein